MTAAGNRKRRKDYRVKGGQRNRGKGYTVPGNICQEFSKIELKHKKPFRLGELRALCGTLATLQMYSTVANQGRVETNKGVGKGRLEGWGRM